MLACNCFSAFDKSWLSACKKAYKAELKILDWIFEEGELDFLSRYETEEFIKDRFNQALALIDIEKVFNADKNSPCYRCIFPEPPKAGLVPSCSEAGVLGVLPGIIGTIQASETIKTVLEIGETLKGRLLTLNALKMDFKDYKIKKDENCKVCGENATIKELIDYEEFCGLKDSLQEIEFKELSGENLKELIDKKEQILLIDVRISADFQARNIYNSKNIPFEDLLNRVSEIDETKKVVLICTIGLKSKEAISKLKKAGYKGELYSLKGGITSWINDNQD